MNSKRIITNTTFDSCGYTLHVTHVQRIPPSSKTILMVNGAMSTTASFSWAVSALDDYNLILFDSPCTGQSKQYNADANYPTRETESAILSDLCDTYEPEYLCAISWGSASTLLALANNPPSVQKAIIAAFSFGLTAEMETLIHDMAHLLNTGEMHAFSDLVNTTLGEFLPDRIKETNKKYLAALTEEEIAYLKLHFEQTLAINKSEAINVISNINVPTLFINGSKDKYTSCHSVDEACIHIKHSSKMEIDSGHFMPMEDRGIATQLKGIVGNYFN